MRKTYRRREQKTNVIPFRVNRDIRVPEVRLVDEKGGNVGVVTTEEAMRRAEAAELDLVEVSPLAQPPVAKILDFHQFKYQREKEMQKAKAKQKKQELKGVRLSLRIGKHDQDFRLNQAIQFLDDGNKLKVELPLRGREHQHTDIAEEIIKSFVEQLKTRHQLVVEQAIQKQAGRLSLICYSAGKVSVSKKSA